MLRGSFWGASVGVCALGLSFLAGGCGGSDESDLKKGTGTGGASGSGGSGNTGGTGAEGGTSGNGGSGGASGSGATGGVAGIGGVGGVAGGDGGTCPDADQDGQTTCAGDCDDADPNNFSGNAEVCGDAKDNDCDGTVDQSCGGIGTYVSSDVGLDTNPGTQAQPLKTIAKGIANAQTIGGGVDVYVSEGHYTEKITLVEGIDLLGGYDCSTAACTWVRDIATNDSAIFDTDAEGVRAGDSITRATKIEGFRIVGQDGGGTGFGRAAITLAGGSPVVSNNVIDGPDVNGGNFQSGRSIGIAILQPTNDPKGGLIDTNTITAGASANTSIAVLFDTATNPAAGKSRAEVRNNKITGGAGNSSNGIAAWTSGSGAIVENNDIFAGNSSANGTSFGIAVGGTLTVNANRINVGGGGTCANTGNWCGGISSFSSTGTFTNNVIVGLDAPRSAGVVLAEAEQPAGLVILNGNTIDAGGASPSTGSGTRSAALVSRIGSCNTCGFNGINGHVRNNVLRGGKGTIRYVVFEDAPSGKTTHPEILQNNLLFFPSPAAASDVLYGQWNGTATVNVTTLAAVNALVFGGATFGANIGGDPLLDSSFHLGSGSPAIDKGTASEAPAKDMDGENRPKGASIDIGADEAS